jgi:hypothetical protein
MTGDLSHPSAVKPGARSTASLASPRASCTERHDADDIETKTQDKLAVTG